MCVFKGVRNVTVLEDLATVLNKWSKGLHAQTWTLFLSEQGFLQGSLLFVSICIIFICHSLWVQSIVSPIYHCWHFVDDHLDKSFSLIFHFAIYSAFTYISRYKKLKERSLICSYFYSMFNDIFIMDKSLYYP